MKKIIKQIPSHLFVFLLGVLLSASGVIAATILSGDEVSYTGNDMLPSYSIFIYYRNGKLNKIFTATI